jgi:hypothetical protein
MRLALTCAVAWVLATAAAWCAESAPPAFTKKPTAAKAGDKVKIDFAVDRETDVAVFIEDGGGKIVRHLVAGVLGKNPPPPLKPGLAQSLEWDGQADYGKPAGAGPFKVRVALGLGAKYDKVVASEPQNIGAVNSLGVGPDGTLYVVHTIGSVGPGWPSQVLTAFNRDGNYQRMLQPFPTGLKTEQVKGVGVAELDGRPVPVLKGFGGRHFYGGGALGRCSLAVTRAGQILYPVRGLRLAAVGTDGSTPCGDFAGPFLFGKSLWTAHGQRVFVAASGDDGAVYLTGAGHCSQTVSAAKLDNPYPAVFKVKLPGRGPAEVFFGDMKTTGNDETHLGGLPSGLALDGKGNLLVGDPANKRVVVISEKDAKFAGSFPAEGADCVAADPASGAVYLTCLTGRGIELVKFSGWKDGKEVARVAVPADGIEREYPYVMAADCSAQPPVIWLGGSRGDNGRLMRVEDLGGKFSDIRRVNTEKLGPMTMMDLSVEHAGKTVYAKGLRYEEAADKLSPFWGQAYHGANMIAPAPDGSIYALSWSEPGSLRRLDRDGKAAPWPGLGKPDAPVIVSMNLTPHTLGVRPADSHAFVFEPVTGTKSDQRINKRLVEFGTDGKRVEGDPLVWCVSDAVIGPKFDAAGNIYIGEQVRPAGQSYPKELGAAADGVCGSIIKFSPATSVKGGGIDWPKPTGRLGYSTLPRAKADAGLKVIEAVTWDVHENHQTPAKVIGAEWMHFGLSHIELVYCNCEHVRFDVDEFGRVFYPDMFRFRVGVLDTNGNEITNFGGYGNADSCGPDSPVIDPKTKLVRPRRPDDPKDLRSPFAEPDIAVSWLLGVGATDRYAYLADMMNRRLLRAKLVYAAEESCEVK